jgi:hypothetical protein
MGAELFHAEGRTDMTNPIVALRNFANVPKNLGLPLRCIRIRSSSGTTTQVGGSLSMLLLFFFCVLYCSYFLYCTVSACDVRAGTLTEVPAQPARSQHTSYARIYTK